MEVKSTNIEDKNEKSSLYNFPNDNFDISFLGANFSQNPANATQPDNITLSNDSSDFVILSDIIPNAILEIRYYSTYNFVGERIDGYEEHTALLTKEAATALKEVSDELEKKDIA